MQRGRPSPFQQRKLGRNSRAGFVPSFKANSQPNLNPKPIKRKMKLEPLNKNINASYVINKNGKAICELQYATLEKLTLRPGFKATPIREWLENLNK